MGGVGRMSDLYTVYFSVAGEPTDARFEFKETATAFADRLAFAGMSAAVVDEFADGETWEERTVYETDPEPLPNGLYLIADTPPQATPLAVEDGSGDRNLLNETLAEADVAPTIDGVHTASVIERDDDPRAEVAIKGRNGLAVRIGVPENTVDPFLDTVREAKYVYGDDEPGDALIG